MADQTRKAEAKAPAPDGAFDLESGRNAAEVREQVIPYGGTYGGHSAGYEVVLAGLGAKARARAKGDDSFSKLVEAGRSLEDSSLGDPELTGERREILAYADVLDRLARERRAFSRMIEAMLPETPLPSSPAVLQARRNAEARLALISEFGLLSSADVARLAGSRAKNRASLANRWKQEGRLFSVSYKGAVLYPAFQFDEQGRPRPVMFEVIRALGSKSREWELALWFIGNTGWLDGRRPVDLLESAPDAVAEAARSEAEDLVY